MSWPSGRRLFRGSRTASVLKLVGAVLVLVLLGTGLAMQWWPSLSWSE
jgi:hypothetical protein